MEELDSKNKILIEKLYFKVKAFLESEYDVEGVIDLNKKNSTKIIFRDREKAITMIKDEILSFASENKIDIGIVKSYLLQMIEEDIKNKGAFEEEYIEVKKIVSMDDEER